MSCSQCYVGERLRVLVREIPIPLIRNLHCLCRRHHRIKHQTGWHVVNIGDNELEWTSPAGRTYRTKPPNTLDHAA